MIYLILPALVGAAGVLQNTLNKRLADTMGLALALFVNSVVVLVLSGLLLLAARLAPQSLPDLFRDRGGWGWGDPRILLPGLLGFAIITLAPLAIARIGATKVFIVVIVAQIVVSLLWDFYAESIPVSPVRLAGAALTLLGALLAVR